MNNSPTIAKNKKIRFLRWLNTSTIIYDKNTELSALLRTLFGKTFDQGDQGKCDRSKGENDRKPGLIRKKIGI